jgi:major membrane immunogen (membrane-anchored lipoprotein)
MINKFLPFLPFPLFPIFTITVTVLCIALAGCGSAPLKDGTYTAESDADDDGAWARVTITVQQGKVADTVFVTLQKDGTVKAEDYGKINGEISNQTFYDKAQLAVRAMKQYEEQFKAAGELSAVEAVSGATIAYNQFMEAAGAALEDARK